MPKYIYACKKCDTHKLVDHKIDEIKVPACELCEEQMQKVIAHYKPKIEINKEEIN